MRQMLKDNKLLFMLFGCLICICLCFNLTSTLAPRANAAGADETFATMANAAATYFAECTSASGGGADDHYNFKKLDRVGNSGYGNFRNGVAFGRYGAFIGFLGDAQKAGVTETSGGNATIYNIDALSTTRIGYLVTTSYTSSGDADSGMYGKTPVTRMTQFSAYVYYGHALSLCGFDEVGLNAEGTNPTRVIIGTLMMALYIASLGVSTFFDLVLTILIYANPFRLFLDANIGVSAADIFATNGAGGGNTTMDTSVVTDISNSITTGMGTIQGYVRSFYGLIQGWSLVVLMPLFLAFALVNWLLINKGGAFWKSFRGFIIRMVFLILGVPMMFACYDATLTAMKNTLTVDNNFGTEVVLSTFCDFESWVFNESLGLPDGVSIQYNVNKRELSSGTSVLVRQYCYNLNVLTGAVGKDSGSMQTTTLNTTDLNKTSALADYDTMLLNSQTSGTLSIDSTTLANTLDILRRYAVGEKIEAARYASMCKTYMQANDLDSRKAYTILTASSATAADFDMNRAATADGHNYGQVDGVNELHLGQSDVETMTTRRFVYQYWPYSNFAGDGTTNTHVQNPWYVNGTDLVCKTTGSNMITFSGTSTAPSLTSASRGLSMIAMYNYLDSQFSDTGVYVQSSASQTVSDTDKWYHYSVSSVGNGLMKIFYLLDAAALMGCLSVVGYGYALALFFANAKAMFQMIPKVFRGMFGSIEGIAASIILTFALICNVIFTVLLYSLSIDIVKSVYHIVEAPLAILFDNFAIFDGIGSIITPVVGLASVYVVVMVTRTLLRWRKAVVQSTTEACTHLINKILQTQQGTPDLSSPADSLGGRMLQGAGMVASLGMAGSAAGLSLDGHGQASKLADNTGLSALRNNLTNEEGTGALDKIRSDFTENGASGTLAALGLGGTAAQASDPLSYSKSGLTETNMADGKFGVSAGSTSEGKADAKTGGSYVSRGEMESAYRNGALASTNGKATNAEGKAYADMNGEELAQAYQDGELFATQNGTEDSYNNISSAALKEAEADRIAGYSNSSSSVQGAGVNVGSSMSDAYASGALVPSGKTDENGNVPSFDNMSEAEITQAYQDGYLVSNGDAAADAVIASTMKTKYSGKNAAKTQDQIAGDYVSSEHASYLDGSVETVHVSGGGQEVIVDGDGGQTTVTRAGGGSHSAANLVASDNSYIDTNAVMSKGGQMLVTASNGVEYVVSDASSNTITTKDGSQTLQIDNDGEIYAQISGTKYVRPVGGGDSGAYSIDSAGNALKVTTNTSNGNVVYTDDQGGNFIMDRNNNSYQLTGGTAVISRTGQQCIITEGGEACTIAPQGGGYFSNAGGGGIHVYNEKGESCVVTRTNHLYKVDESDPSMVIGNHGQRIKVDAKGNEYIVNQGVDYVTRGGKYYAIDEAGNAIPYDLSKAHTTTTAPRTGSTQTWVPPTGKGGGVPGSRGGKR